MLLNEIIDNINIGYRANDPVSLYGTEGNGVYVARDKEFAKVFGKNIITIRYKNPKKPLIVNEEPLPLLQEEYPIFDPISPQDSIWIKINKQAVQEAGLTEEGEWDVELACKFLTNILKRNKYDLVRVTSGGEGWDVILDTSLIIK